MFLNNASFKLFVLKLFQVETPSGWQERSFPLDKLPAASSLLRKLKDDAEDLVNDEGEPIGIKFATDDGLELTLDETIVLRDLIQGVTQGTPSDLEAIEGIKQELEDANKSTK